MATKTKTGAKRALTLHRFTFTLRDAGDGPEEVSDERLDAILGATSAAGLNDAALWSEGPTVYLGVDRRAENLLDAISSAFSDVQRAGFEVSNIKIDTDPLEGSEMRPK